MYGAANRVVDKESTKRIPPGVLTPGGILLSLQWAWNNVVRARRGGDFGMPDSPDTPPNYLSTTSQLMRWNTISNPRVPLGPGPSTRTINLSGVVRR